MDFTSLSASRLDARVYPCAKDDVEFREFQSKHRKSRGNPQTSKEVFEALFSTVEGDVGNLSHNLINANIAFGELASLTDKDLELIGCKDQNQRKSLLEFFRLLPNQEHSYTQIMESEEAQLYNETILKRTTAHLDSMRSALAAANYKLKIVPAEDIVLGEKNFASRFVLDALDELHRVTNDIEVQLKEFEKELNTSSEECKKNRTKLNMISVLFSSAIFVTIGFYVWKTVRSK